MYNKRQFHRVNDKKVLHKIRKQWVTISIALLALIGGSILAGHVNVSANSNNSGSNTQNQSNHANNLHNRLVTSTHTNVQDTNDSSNSVQNIERQTNQVHRNILTHAMMNTHAINTNLPNNSDTSRKIVSYRTTINGEPAKRINNINRLRIHHAANYKGFIFSRINIPFKHITIRHIVSLYNHIFLNERHYKYHVKYDNAKILKAYKQYGHMGIYTRYLIHIHHTNHYIDGNSKFVAFVAPSKHYKYYQRKINKILNDAHNHKFNKVRRAVRNLNHKHVTNYKRYMNLYINAYNLQQNIQHPVVVNYHHKYVHYKYNHTYNSKSRFTNESPNPSTNNLPSTTSSDNNIVNSLETPASNESSNVVNNLPLLSSLNIPNIPAPVAPFSNNDNLNNIPNTPINSSASINDIIPNNQASSKNDDNKLNSDSLSNLISDIASASNTVQSASGALSLISNKASTANSVFNSVKSHDSSEVNSYTSASQNYKLANKAYNLASKALNSASKANNSIAENNARNSESAAQSFENSYSIIMNDTSSVYDDYALASTNDSNAISVLNSVYSVYSSANNVESSIINNIDNKPNVNPQPTPNSSASNSNDTSSADNSIANSYRNSISASVSATNQNKAKSAANSADQSIESSIASSAKISADGSIAASVSNSVADSLSRLDDSIANSAAKSTEDTSYYKNSVSASNSRTASLAAKLADNSLDSFIAGSYANSADDSIANSYSASISNSVSSLDNSIAKSAANSANSSIASSVAKSTNDSIASSAANSADKSIANSYRNSISASVSIADQSKANSAASSADNSINNSIASSAASSADKSIDNSIANSAAKSTENTSSYKNSVSAANDKITSLAAKSADSSIDASIAGSAASSADKSIATSYHNLVSNSVSALDSSIASSAAKSADESIVAHNIASASQASVIDQFISEMFKDVNQARQAKNLNKLQLNSDLENVSKLRAKQLITNDNSSFQSDVDKLGYMELAANLASNELLGHSSVNTINGKLPTDNIFNDFRTDFLDKNTADIGIGVAYNNEDKNYYFVIDKTTKIQEIPSNERYLMPDNNDKSIKLNNIDSDGTFNGYSYSSVYGPSYIIKRRNILGYNFDEVNGPLNNNNSEYWVFSDELSKNPSAKFTNVNEWNKFINTLDQESAKYYTSDELDRIDTIRQQYSNLLENENSNDISTSNKISEYHKHIIDWVNFYRGLHGLQPVTEDSSFDNYAQKHAEAESDPECMIIDGHKSDATSAPNAISPLQITDYYTDTNDADRNGTPGHRVSLLNPRAINIGVGEKGSVNTLYFGHGANNPIISKSGSMTYPNAGIYPINYANQGNLDYWGYSFINPNTINRNVNPISYNGIMIQNPSVTVHDDTAHKYIGVGDIHNDYSLENGNLNSYSGAIYYKVNPNALRVNHQYTITISGQGIPNGSYTYSTRLFEL